MESGQLSCTKKKGSSKRKRGKKGVVFIVIDEMCSTATLKQMEGSLKMFVVMFVLFVFAILCLCLCLFSKRRGGWKKEKVVSYTNYSTE